MCACESNNGFCAQNFSAKIQKICEKYVSLKVFSYFCTKKKDIFMENKRPLVLISNDDGYHANGIKTLVRFLTDWCDVLVVAPESARSGFACAVSATTPLRLKRRHNMGEDVEVWSCSGTPVDCVKLALDQFYKDRRPDLVIGGINHGDNSSVNNHY